MKIHALIVVYFGSVIQKCVSAQVDLSIYPLSVSEYSPQTLTCTYSGARIASVFWKLGERTVRLINIVNNSCETFGDPNSTLYNYTCNAAANTFTLTILNVTRANKGQLWYCEIYANEQTIKSQPVTPDIIVPISSVTMTQPMTDVVAVQVNTTAVFVCETSGGLPAARVTWFNDSGTPDNTVDDIDITASSSVSTSNTSDNLIKVSSKLTFSAQKPDRNMRIYCRANNGGSTALVSFRKPLLNVQYPPESSPFIQQGNIFKVIEKTQATLSCSVIGGNPLANLTWNCKYDIITDRTSGATVTMEISWTASRGQDGSCSCVSTHFNWMKSVSTSIEILFAPFTPTFSIGASPVNDIVRVIENTTLSISCTSNSNPLPTYTWLYKGITTTGNELTIPNIQKSDSGLCTCEAKNTMVPSVGTNVTDKQNSSITVQVLYPPKSSQLRYGSLTGQVIDMNTLEVIEGDSFNVTCISDGEPTPQYQWSQQSGHSQILFVNNINGNQTRTCTVNNTMKDVFGETRGGIKVSNLQVFVMYPPTIPVLSYKNQAGSTATVTNNHRVIENTTFSISCTANSRPTPSYNWRPSGSSNLDTLSLTNVKRSQQGVYTCEVSNKMMRTFSDPGQEVIGRNSKNFDLDILYSPEVRPLVSEDIVEGQPFAKVCDVTPGNPSTTTFTWTKVTDTRQWQMQTLSIINVSRSDASNYTCTATNMMSPTVESVVIGEDSKSFYLNVWYSSSIKLFTLNGDQETLTVSEKDTNLPVICDVDSNPGSVITIEHNGKTLSTQNDAKQLKYSLERAQCTDAGYYRCIGRNAYNTQPAVKEIRLFVKCSPRPSPFVPLIDRVRTGLNRSTSLGFSALSYPEPTEFQWFKETDSALLPIEHTNNTIITSEAFNTSLTIVSVTENTFGKYLLTVHNEFGVWNQSYFIEAYDKPEQPKQFKSLDEKATLSSVTLQWVPGFNGGQPQIFVLQYRKIGTEQWITVNINHNNETMMTYPLQHLSSGTQYEVVVYATNNIGDSEHSQSITVSTNDEPSPPSYGAMIGGAVGGGAGLAILVVVIVLFSRRLRMRNGKDSSQLALNKTGKTATSDDSSDEDEVVENAMYQSAGPLKTTDDNVYAKPAKSKKVDVKDANVYASVDKTKKTENQKAKKGKQTKKKHNVQGDIYENAPEKTVAVDNTYGNAAFEDNPYENPETTKTKQTQKKTVNKDGLIYADLDFKDQPKGQKKLVIHGLDQMTDYVQVDFTKKADPLPDSDTEEQATKKQ